MAITKKPKQEQVAAPVETSKQVVTPKVKGGVVTEDQALINEAAQINARLEELEVPAMQKRLDEIKKVFQAKGKELPQDEEAVFVGTEGRLVFSKARVELEITDRNAMIKALGQKVFNEIAKVTLTDMKKYLSEGEIFAFAQQVYGSRSIKVIEKL